MGVLPPGEQEGTLEPSVTPGQAVPQLVTILVLHDVVQLQLDTMSV